VTDKATKRHVGLWYFDPFARAGKRSGAWMNAYRNQQRMDGKDILTLVSNNSNFIKAAPGEPILISWDDATTLFHELVTHLRFELKRHLSVVVRTAGPHYVEFPGS
jgi:peptidyl-dipeptidase Dcp